MADEKAAPTAETEHITKTNNEQNVECIEIFSSDDEDPSSKGEKNKTKQDGRTNELVGTSPTVDVIQKKDTTQDVTVFYLKKDNEDKAGSTHSKENISKDNGGKSSDVVEVTDDKMACEADKNSKEFVEETEKQNTGNDATAEEIENIAESVDHDNGKDTTDVNLKECAVKGGCADVVEKEKNDKPSTPTIVTPNVDGAKSSEGPHNQRPGASTSGHHTWTQPGPSLSSDDDIIIEQVVKAPKKTPIQTTSSKAKVPYFQKKLKPTLSKASGLNQAKATVSDPDHEVQEIPQASQSLNRPTSVSTHKRKVGRPRNFGPLSPYLKKKEMQGKTFKKTVVSQKQKQQVVSKSQTYDGSASLALDVESHPDELMQSIVESIRKPSDIDPAKDTTNQDEPTVSGTADTTDKEVIELDVSGGESDRTESRDEVTYNDSSNEDIFQEEEIEDSELTDADDQSEQAGTSTGARKVLGKKKRLGIPASCRTCGKSFDSLNSMERHMVIHLDFKLFKCRFCKFKTSDSSCYVKHLRQRHKTIINKSLDFKCGLCGDNLFGPTPLLRHAMTHAKNKTAALISDKSRQFKTKGKRGRPKKSKNKKDKSISKETDQTQNLSPDTITESSVPEGESVTRPSATLSSDDEVIETPVNDDEDNVNMEDVSVQAEDTDLPECSKMFDCIQCDISCTDTYFYIDHIKTQHSSSVQFQCPLCLTIFVEENNFIKHLRVKNCQCDRSLHCSNCEYIATDTTDLAEHGMNIHTLCHVCRKEFATLEGLQRHLATHLQIKPFRCDKCQYLTSDSSTFVRHMKFVHKEDDVTYECHKCKIFFKGPTELTRHVFNHATMEDFEKIKDPKSNESTNFQCPKCKCYCSDVKSYDVHTSHCKPAVEVVKGMPSTFIRQPITQTSPVAIAQKTSPSTSPGSAKSPGSTHKVFRCTKCHFISSNTNEHIAHVISKHNAKNIRYQCHLCKLLFDAPDKLVNHIATHSTGKVSDGKSPTESKTVSVKHVFTSSSISSIGNIQQSPTTSPVKTMIPSASSSPAYPTILSIGSVQQSTTSPTTSPAKNPLPIVSSPSVFPTVLSIGTVQQSPTTSPAKNPLPIVSSPSVFPTVLSIGKVQQSPTTSPAKAPIPIVSSPSAVPTLLVGQGQVSEEQGKKDNASSIMQAFASAVQANPQSQQVAGEQQDSYATMPPLGAITPRPNTTVLTQNLSPPAAAAVAAVAVSSSPMPPLANITYTLQSPTKSSQSGQPTSSSAVLQSALSSNAIATIATSQQDGSKSPMIFIRAPSGPQTDPSKYTVMIPPPIVLPAPGNSSQGVASSPGTITIPPIMAPSGARTNIRLKIMSYQPVVPSSNTAVTSATTATVTQVNQVRLANSTPHNSSSTGNIANALQSGPQLEVITTTTTPIQTRTSANDDDVVQSPPPEKEPDTQDSSSTDGSTDSEDEDRRFVTIKQEPKSDNEGEPKGEVYRCTICQTEYVQASALLRHQTLLHVGTEAGDSQVIASGLKAVDDGSDDENRGFSVTGNSPSGDSDTEDGDVGFHYTVSDSDDEDTDTANEGREESDASQGLHNYSKGTGKHLCLYCKRLFPTKRAVQSHMKAHQTKEAKCTFEECGKSFTSAAGLRRHMMIHLGVRPFECKSCNIFFNDSSAFIKHSRQKHGIEDAKYHCPYCTSFAPVTSPKVLLNHMAAHVEHRNQEQVHKCSHCQCLVKNAADLQAHVENKHDTSKRRYCFLCRSIFQTKAQLITHQQTHLPKMPFHCKVCEFQTSEVEKYTTHMIRSHNWTTVVYPCPLCDKVFVSGPNLLKHEVEHASSPSTLYAVCEELCYLTAPEIQEHDHDNEDHEHRGHGKHKKQGKHKHKHKKHKKKQDKDQDHPASSTQAGDSYTCNQCGSSFAPIYGLRRHLWIHCNEKPFHCGQCKYKTGDVTGYINHMRNRHKLTKIPYRCCVCKKSCKKSADLIQHYDSEHPTSLYVCFKCGEPCESYWKLNEHFGLPNCEGGGEGCRYCGKTFPKHFQIARHIKTHTKPYVCPMLWCLQRYSENKPMLNHKQNVHKGIWCSICPTKFKFKEGHKAHEKLHKEPVSYSCAACKRSYRNFDDFVSHTNIFLENYQDMKCGVCGLVVSLPCEMLLHEQKHLKSSPIRCQFCHTMSPDISALNKHQREKHGVVSMLGDDDDVDELRQGSSATGDDDAITLEQTKLTRMECPYCSRMFVSSITMKTHLREIHKIQEDIADGLVKTIAMNDKTISRAKRGYDEEGIDSTKQGRKFQIDDDDDDDDDNDDGASDRLTCKFCNAKFTDKALLKSHEAAHSASVGRPFPATFSSSVHECKYCGFTFKTAYELKEHEYVHTGVQPSRDDIKPTESLKEKEEQVEEEKEDDEDIEKEEEQDQQVERDGQYACPFCDLKSSSRQNLMKHIMSHAGQNVTHGGKLNVKVEMSFKCNVCSASFRYREMLKKHKKKHSSGEEGLIYKCSVCSKEFNHIAKYYRHRMVAHGGEANIKGKKTKRSRGRPRKVKKKKMSTSASDDVIECDDQMEIKELERSTNDASLLKGTSSTLFRYSCEFCSKKFRKKKRWNQHVVQVHKIGVSDVSKVSTDVPKDDKLARPSGLYGIPSSSSKARGWIYPHKCSECNALFRKKRALDRHQLYLHGNKRTQGKMSQILSSAALKPKRESDSSNKSSLKKASKNIESVKKWICVSCGERFFREVTLLRHLATHKSKLEKELNKDTSRGHDHSSSSDTESQTSFSTQESEGSTSVWKRNVEPGNEAAKSVKDSAECLQGVLGMMIKKELTNTDTSSSVPAHGKEMLPIPEVDTTAAMSTVENLADNQPVWIYPYNCEFCGAQFCKRSIYDRHMRKHRKRKPKKDKTIAKESGEGVTGIASNIEQEGSVDRTIEDEVVAKRARKVQDDSGEGVKDDSKVAVKQELTSDMESLIEDEVVSKRPQDQPREVLEESVESVKDDTNIFVKRSRGRPKKECLEVKVSPIGSSAIGLKRSRGRPKGSTKKIKFVPTRPPAQPKKIEFTKIVAKRPRGRPRKVSRKRVEGVRDEPLIKKELESNTDNLNEDRIVAGYPKEKSHESLVQDEQSRLERTISPEDSDKPEYTIGMVLKSLEDGEGSNSDNDDDRSISRLQDQAQSSGRLHDQKSRDDQGNVGKGDVVKEDDTLAECHKMEPTELDSQEISTGQSEQMEKVYGVSSKPDEKISPSSASSGIQATEECSVTGEGDETSLTSEAQVKGDSLATSNVYDFDEDEIQMPIPGETSSPKSASPGLSAGIETPEECTATNAEGESNMMSSIPDNLEMSNVYDFDDDESENQTPGTGLDQKETDKTISDSPEDQNSGECTVTDVDRGEPNKMSSIPETQVKQDSLDMSNVYDFDEEESGNHTPLAVERDSQNSVLSEVTDLYDFDEDELENQTPGAVQDQNETDNETIIASPEGQNQDEGDVLDIEEEGQSQENQTSPGVTNVYNFDDNESAVLDQNETGETILGSPEGENQDEGDVMDIERPSRSEEMIDDKALETGHEADAISSVPETEDKKDSLEMSNVYDFDEDESAVLDQNETDETIFGSPGGENQDEGDVLDIEGPSQAEEMIDDKILETRHDPSVMSSIPETQDKGDSLEMSNVYDFDEDESEIQTSGDVLDQNEMDETLFGSTESENQDEDDVLDIEEEGQSQADETIDDQILETGCEPNIASSVPDTQDEEDGLKMPNVYDFDEDELEIETPGAHPGVADQDDMNVESDATIQDYFQLDSPEVLGDDTIEQSEDQERPDVVSPKLPVLEGESANDAEDEHVIDESHLAAEADDPADSPNISFSGDLIDTYNEQVFDSTSPNMPEDHNKSDIAGQNDNIESQSDLTPGNMFEGVSADSDCEEAVDEELVNEQQSASAKTNMDAESEERADYIVQDDDFEDSLDLTHDSKPGSGLEEVGSQDDFEDTAAEDEYPPRSPMIQASFDESDEDASANKKTDVSHSTGNNESGDNPDEFEYRSDFEQPTASASPYSQEDFENFDNTVQDVPSDAAELTRDEESKGDVDEEGAMCTEVSDDELQCAISLQMQEECDETDYAMLDDEAVDSPDVVENSDLAETDGQDDYDADVPQDENQSAPGSPLVREELDESEGSEQEDETVKSINDNESDFALADAQGDFGTGEPQDRHQWALESPKLQGDYEDISDAELSQD